MWTRASNAAKTLKASIASKCDAEFACTKHNMPLVYFFRLHSVKQRYDEAIEISSQQLVIPQLFVNKSHKRVETMESTASKLEQPQQQLQGDKPCETASDPKAEGPPSSATTPEVKQQQPKASTASKLDNLLQKAEARALAAASAKPLDGLTKGRTLTKKHLFYTFYFLHLLSFMQSFCDTRSFCLNIEVHFCVVWTYVFGNVF